MELPHKTFLRIGTVTQKLCLIFTRSVIFYAFVLHCFAVDLNAKTDFIYVNEKMALR